MRGDEYWRATRFARATTWLAETTRLKEKNVKCHTFHLREGAADKCVDQPLFVNSVVIVNIARLPLKCKFEYLELVHVVRAL